MFAGRIERRDHPSEQGQWVEFRTLSGRQLDEAEQVEVRRQFDLVKGVDLEAIRKAAPTGARREPDPIERFNKDFLILCGVVNCSMCDNCTPETKESFDAVTRDWAVSVIAEMNLRPLVSSNDSGASLLEAGSHTNSTEHGVSSVPA